MRDLAAKILLVERERDEALDEVDALKRRNDELSLTSMDAEQIATRQREKIAGAEEQLRKLEAKVTLSDITLANQVIRLAIKLMRTGSRLLRQRSLIDWEYR